LQGRLQNGALGDGLGPEEARALERARTDCGEEEEALGARRHGRPQEACRGHRVQLLHRGVRLVADRRRQVDDGLDPAKRLAAQVLVVEPAEIAEGELNLDPVAAETPWIADERTDRVSFQQQRQQCPADGARGSGEQDHARTLDEWFHDIARPDDAPGHPRP
jgi:hypothetical protein